MKNLLGEDIVEEKEEVFKKPAHKPFESSALMFSNPKEFTKIPLYEKSKDFFFNNRTFAIKQPLIANAFNDIKINTGQAYQCWCDMLSPIYSKTPSWIFSTLRGVKTIKESKKESFDPEVVRFYCKKNMLSPKDFEDLDKFCHERLVEDLEEYGKLFDDSKVEKTKVKKK